VQQCRKEKKQTGSRSLLNTGMGLLPVSTLTPGHFGTVTGSPANVKSKAVSSPGRSSACTPTGDANASHHPNSRVSPLKRPQDEPLEAERRQRACKYVYQPQRRVIGHQVSSTFRAVLPLACCGLLEHADMFGTSRDVHGLRSPQCKSVDWST
jgi:hypothetical protein